MKKWILNILICLACFTLVINFVRFFVMPSYNVNTTYYGFEEALDALSNFDVPVEEFFDELSVTISDLSGILKSFTDAYTFTRVDSIRDVVLNIKNYISSFYDMFRSIFRLSYGIIRLALSTIELLINLLRQLVYLFNSLFGLNISSPSVQSGDGIGEGFSGGGFGARR